MTEPREPMVRLTGVTRRFGAVTAVDAVDLAVGQGDFLTIVGPSGCGKTTLLRMIAGFDRPDAGEIELHGARVEAVPPHKRSIGMVFQKLALFPHMTAAQNVAYPLKMRRFDPSDIPGRVTRYLDLVQLGGYGARRPHELSGGQQQRVAIARALSFGPDLLLLDEPLSALDKKLREEMQLEFRRIQQELGVTTINVTHDQREALVMSDRIVVMQGGVVQQSASPVEVYRAPQNPFVAGFIGMTSQFQGEVAEADGTTVSVRVGGAALRAAAGGAGLRPGMRADCAIRAEQIHLLDTADQPFDNLVPGIVCQRVFEGDRMLYAIEAEGMGIVLKVFDHDPVSHREHPLGSRVTMGWNSRDLHAFPAA